MKKKTPASRESFSDIVKREGIGVPPPKDAPPRKKKSAVNVTIPPADADSSAYESKLEYAMNGVAEREVSKLHKATIKTGDSVDLHAKTAAEAYEAFVAFISDAVARGCKVIEIIHGRGTHSPDGKPVLRGKVRMWVAECSAVKGYVTVYNNGAIRVLLKHK